MQQQKTYGLMTAIAMIIGIVVGSGIYFKADDILAFTGGNVLLGLLVLTIGASNIIFGSLSLSEFAKLETTSGGVAAYFERFASPALATGFGWFQTFVLMPSVSAIIAWASALYTDDLLGLHLSFTQQILLGAGYILLLSAINILSRRLGGVLQSLSTLIKMVPLFAIAIIGLFWGKAAPAIPAGVTEVLPHDVGFGWLSALVPLAFTYEGWNYVVTISPELKNPKRDLIRALILGPAIILITYLLFFYGMIRILGASFIMSTGNKAITYAITTVFGDKAGNLILVVVVISMLGVLNGLLLAGFRMPQALAEKGMLNPPSLATLHPKYQLNLTSCFTFVGVSLAWLALHYVLTSSGIFQNIDISEVAIVFNYICYIVLYSMVLRLYRQGIAKNRFTAFIAPCIGIAGSVLVIVGSLISSFSLTLIFNAFCAAVVLAGFLFYRQHHH